jgi:hypothetical protein
MRLIQSWGTTFLWGALAIGAGACKSSDPTNNEPATPTPTTITVVDGSGQAGTVGGALGASLLVQVNDQNNAAMAGISVTFAVTAGGGSVSPNSANTNSSGQA